MLASACAEQPDDTQEIIDNLMKAGFPRADIMIVNGVVYAGRDAEVSLEASREMLQSGSGKEQYRTNNLVSSSLAKICINGSTFTGVFSTALDLAIQNYEEQPLTFAMARTPSTGCGFTINAVIQPGVVGGSSGFPSGGVPFGTINIGGGLSTFSVDTIEHVITHEIGHTIGFRHSDFFNRSISCGGAAVNEGDGGVGAILVPGTPSDATVGGSLMNSCFRQIETGEFSASDVTALQALYGTAPPPGAHVPFFRYYNGRFHFYTANFAELGNGAGGYVLEGNAGFVSLTPIQNTAPLFRYVFAPNGAHFYTTNIAELGGGGGGWVLEGTAAYVPVVTAPGTTNFFRYVNNGTGDHFYTANFGELGNGASGYTLEGVQSLIFTGP